MPESGGRVCRVFVAACLFPAGENGGFRTGYPFWPGNRQNGPFSATERGQRSVLSAVLCRVALAGCAGISWPVRDGEGSCAGRERAVENRCGKAGAGLPEKRAFRYFRVWGGWGFRKRKSVPAGNAFFRKGNRQLSNSPGLALWTRYRSSWASTSPRTAAFSSHLIALALSFLTPCPR